MCKLKYLSFIVPATRLQSFIIHLFYTPLAISELEKNAWIPSMGKFFKIQFLCIDDGMNNVDTTTPIVVKSKVNKILVGWYIHDT